ncbi:MAG: tRNA uridine-5-carboxymethylaminomethyl(34) synthesis enzyme MnmG [Calditrichaeota bacterium]|nr:MAG: tRNA uridine-5-carboxymethylaminomethyl(34) synthesis enzyme MnmG [Calditrichota bacterium]
MNYDFDVIIIGGGHAGVEAADVSARMGKKAGLITMDASKLALMSCNPAIGGIGKSHLVKEIDALGGLMGKAIDATGIQFRRLNLSRGPAVWSTRVQADRIKYNDYVVNYIKEQHNIEVIEALAGKLLTENGSICGVLTENGDKITCRTVIICSGTFLGGLIHIGPTKIKAGRLGENAAYKLSDSLDELGFELGRLKTGTPPRLNGDTIDFDKCELQPGDTPIPYYTNDCNRPDFKQMPCYLTYTTAETKAIVSKHFNDSPIFSGQINSTGPRYCPSIEDKFYRFADKERHQLFLEPEGNGTNEIYPNGFSTALPEEIQHKAIRTVEGLEKVEITKPGYAVEYDYCPAYQIKPNLETKRVSGLFFAGQINGTSGYEEAAGQGLMAGINAVLYLEKEKPFILDRSEAYLGVMIDDLTTRSTTEPYRLFTSRAEYRLAIREDNARDRMYRYARRFNLVDEAKLDAFDKLVADTSTEIGLLKSNRIHISQLGEVGERFKRKDSISLEEYLKQPGVTVHDLIPLLGNFNGDFSDNREILERAAIDIKYAGYIEKQQREINKFKKMENESIPEQFDYTDITGLKNEAKEKFTRFRPISLGQASRIEGITPGDVAVLSIYLKKHKDTITK